MIKNFKDTVVLSLITAGVLILISCNHCWRLLGRTRRKISPVDDICKLLR
jgi:hypothetical protein